MNIKTYLNFPELQSPPRRADAERVVDVEVVANAF